LHAVIEIKVVPVHIPPIQSNPIYLNQAYKLFRTCTFRLRRIQEFHHLSFGEKSTVNNQSIDQPFASVIGLYSTAGMESFWKQRWIGLGYISEHTG